MSQAATAFQRSKRQYLDLEEALEQLVCSRDFHVYFQSWLDSTLAALESQYGTCEARLAELQHTVAVDEGQYWTTKTLMQHCNLCVTDKRLLVQGAPRESHPSWTGLIQLISVLNSLKNKGFITPKQVRFLEKVEADLHNVVFDPSELRTISEALTTKLTGEAESQAVVADLTKFQTLIDEVVPDLDSCEQLLEAAILNGDMMVAEKISYRQIDMHEHVLSLIGQQYPILQRRHAEAQLYARRRRWAITHMTNRDVGGVVESKLRQVEACNDDLERLKEQMDNYQADDSSQRRRYDLDKAQSDKFLESNQERQHSVWNRIHDLLNELGQCQDELQDLAQQRRKEIDRRLRMEEREAGRRSGHHAFIRVAEVHQQKLEYTIENAQRAKTLAKSLNDFVLDGCDSVAAKFDRRQRSLDEVLRVVQNNHFRRFSEFYIAAGRLLYRKEKKMQQINEEMDVAHIKLELAQDTFDLNAKAHANRKKELLEQKKSLASEIVALRHRVDVQEQNVNPVLRAYEYRGVPYIHPRDVLTKVNLDRADRILEFRESLKPGLSPQEVLQREDEQCLMDYRRKAEAIEDARRQRHLAIEGSPSRLGGTEATRQYQRFQEILEKKLAAPVPTTSPPLLAIGNRGAIGQDRAAKDVSPVPTPSRPPEATNQQKVPTLLPAAPSSPATPQGSMRSRSRRFSGVVPGSTLRALYSYSAVQPDELSFAAGDRIICLAPASEEGWYSGVCNQRTGLFPINYVATESE